MHWYLVNAKTGKARKLRNGEVETWLKQSQIEEGMEAKRNDPLEEVSYYVDGHYVVYDY